MEGGTLPWTRVDSREALLQLTTVPQLAGTSVTFLQSEEAAARPCAQETGAAAGSPRTADGTLELATSQGLAGTTS